MHLSKFSFRAFEVYLNYKQLSSYVPTKLTPYVPQIDLSVYPGPESCTTTEMSHVPGNYGHVFYMAISYQKLQHSPSV
jgi:hypothetical protein